MAANTGNHSAAGQTRDDSPRVTHLPPRIVVAEDDEEMRRLIAAALRKDGFDVTEVSDGMRLLVHVIGRDGDPERAYDLIISDLRMPATSGLQVLRGLRNSGFTIPFILCTAFGDELTRKDAENLSAIYFDKPFELDELRNTVRHMLLPTEAHRGKA
jgi:DNA-binding response OmpR family regulator